MAESNQLHAVCMDSMPPLNYLNADSHALIEFVHAFNAVSDETRLAYTFDAGPNCCLLMETTTLKDFYAAFNRRFEFDQALVKLPEG
jgi:diphosphomevalonate decarboxylase